jgi:hypothetical protein
MKEAFGSIKTTSILYCDSKRMYFAAVAPPKPPPTITTLAFDGIEVVAQPAKPSKLKAAADCKS